MGQGRSIVEQRRALMSRRSRMPPGGQAGFDVFLLQHRLRAGGDDGRAVTKTPWEDLMSGRVFGPLGMASAGYGPPGTQGRSTMPGATGPRATWSRPSTTTTPRRLGRPGRSTARSETGPSSPRSTSGGASAGSSLVKPETLKALHTPGPGEEYVGGWLVGRVGPGPAVGPLTHNGSNNFWYCTIWARPGAGLRRPGRDQRGRQAGRGGLRAGDQWADPARHLGRAGATTLSASDRPWGTVRMGRSSTLERPLNGRRHGDWRRRPGSRANRSAPIFRYASIRATTSG